MNMTDFINSNYIKGEDIAQNVLIEATIASVKMKEFEDGEKSVVALEDGRQLILNQTRLKALIGAFGPNSENWIGKSVILSRGLAPYAGKIVPAVKIEPIVAPRIAAEPRQRLITVGSGKGAPTDQAPAYDEANPPPVDAIDEDISF